MAGLCFSLLNLLIVFNVGSVITQTRKNTNSLRNIILDPLDASVNEGSAIKLECRASSAIRHCFWKRDNNYTVTPGITGRYILIGSFERGECTMRIEAADLTLDNGVWVCNVVLQNKEETKKSLGANVTVIRAPKSLKILQDDHTVSSSMNSPASSEEEVFQRLFANVTLRIGQNATEVLSCISEQGNPAAKLVWLKEMDVIKDIHRAEPDPNLKNTFTVVSYPDFVADTTYHRTLIQCQAEHDAYDNRIISVHFRLFVEHPTSEVEIRREKENAQSSVKHEIAIHIGRPEIIECRANGFPLPKYFWVKRNSLKEDELIEGNSSLLIGNSLQDGGIYWCLAGNNMNDGVVKSSRNFTVQVEYPTNNVTIESDDSTAVSAGGAIHLKCQTDGFPFPQIRWLKKYGDGWYHIGGGKLFIINNFTAEDQGYYHCLAFNKLNNKDVESLPVHLYLLESDKGPNNSSSLNCRPLRPCIICILSALLYIYVHLHCKN